MTRTLWIFLFASTLACQAEQPPKPDADVAEQAAAEPAVLNADTDEFILTYAGERGVFADVKTIAEVPEAARNRVGVNVFGRKPPAGNVFVTNLSAPLPDGTYALEVVPRDEFVDSVLGSGRSSKYEVRGDLVELVRCAPEV